MNVKFTLKKFENENKSLNSEKNNLVNELEMLQGNFCEYQKKYLDGNRKMQKFEAAAKKLLLENEKLGKERDLYKSSGCSGVGSCGGSRVGSPGRWGASGKFDWCTTKGSGEDCGSGLDESKVDLEVEVEVEVGGGDGITVTTLD